jgi:flagellar biosynthesis protein FlhB
MADDGRNVQPSPARVAAAAQGGLFARSRLLVTGATLVVAGTVGGLVANTIGARLRLLLDQGLAQAVQLRGDPAQALSAGIASGLAILLPLLIAIALVAALVSAAPALAARQGRGSTAVRLPRRSRRYSSGVLAALGVSLFAIVALLIVRSYGGSAVLMASGAAVDASWIGELVLALVAAAGGIMVLAGVADLALDRARLLRDLRLTSSESQREQRAARGDPAVRQRAHSEARKGGGRP